MAPLMARPLPEVPGNIGGVYRGFLYGVIKGDARSLDDGKRGDL